jgi:molybdenum cofactor biosynthesis enzyme MoaA
MSKQDTCLKCGQVGHTSSSCKRVQCVACESFRMTVRGALQKCIKKAAAWSPSPVFMRDCSRFTKVKPEVEQKRREALRAMGSVAA